MPSSLAKSKIRVLLRPAHLPYQICECRNADVYICACSTRWHAPGLIAPARLVIVRPGHCAQLIDYRFRQTAPQCPRQPASLECLLHAGCRTANVGSPPGLPSACIQAYGSHGRLYQPHKRTLVPRAAAAHARSLQVCHLRPAPCCSVRLRPPRHRPLVHVR